MKIDYTEAREIISKKKIKLQGEGNSREFWDVAGVPIEIRRNKEGTIYLCRCQHHSIYGNDSVCQFKAAIISYFTLKQFARKKE